MKLVRGLVPTAALTRVRLVALLFACVTIAPQLTTMNTELSGPHRIAGAVAIVALVVGAVITFVARRTTLVEPLVIPVLITMAGSSLADPQASLALCLGALAHFTMYGTRWYALGRTALIVAAYVSSILISPAADAIGVAWYNHTYLGPVPTLVMTGLLNATLRSMLVEQQRVATRESLLARAGQHLISLKDAADVRRVAAHALRALCAEWPGYTVLVLTGEPDGTVAVEAVGGRHRPEAATVPKLRLTDIAEGNDLSEPGADVAQVLNFLVGERLCWWGLCLGGGDQPRALVIGGRRRPLASMANALRTLGIQWSMAETNCTTHAELVHRAENDQLTDLPNRRYLMDRLAAERDNSDANTGCLAFLLIDLDDFKQVNDVYGHSAGDNLLIEVASRIAAAADETGMAARFGGDEFALLLNGLEGPEEADRIADQLRLDLLRPIRIPETTVTVGASIGIAVASPELTAGDLIRCADIAMYSAKARGKNRVERFTETNHGNVAHVRRTEEHLPYAVARGEITIDYQPYFDLGTGRCVGVEALARWNHPTIGPVPPATFIPLATRTGHIKPLGTHILRRACAQLAEWRTDPAAAQLRVSVNIAASQVYDPAFPEIVERALAEAGLPADRLILELTEEEPLEPRLAAGPLSAVAQLGVRIAVDDFGTGYASFTALRLFPVHQLKIDRSLISGADTIDGAMLQIVASAGEVLGIETVGEGAETLDQVAVLRRAGVQIAQGFALAAPMPAGEFPGWLATEGDELPAWFTDLADSAEEKQQTRLPSATGRH